MFRIALALFIGSSLAFRVQVPGLVEITSPGGREAVTGLVTIHGTADHPLFIRYDLSFSLDPDPTDTWFNIGEPVEARVIDDRLGIWDTSGITDGNYRLRLRVSFQDGGSISMVVDGLQVRNYTPLEALESEPIVQIETTATPVPTVESARIESSAQAQKGNVNPLLMGAFGGGVLLIALGAYVRLRRALRLQAARMKSRQAHRRSQRNKGKP
jgi:hypothetical protein